MIQICLFNYLFIQTIFWTQRRNSLKPVLGLREDSKVARSLQKAEASSFQDTKDLSLASSME